MLGGGVQPMVGAGIQPSSGVNENNLPSGALEHGQQDLRKKKGRPNIDPVHPIQIVRRRRLLATQSNQPGAVNKKVEPAESRPDAIRQVPDIPLLIQINPVALSRGAIHANGRSDFLQGCHPAAEETKVRTLRAKLKSNCSADAASRAAYYGNLSFQGDHRYTSFIISRLI
jgi:hypothetical protein